MNSSNKHKRIVIITSRFPYPLEKGDKLRAYHQIKQLSKFFEIDLISTTENNIKQEYIQQLEPYCKSIQIYTLSFFQRIWGIFKSLIDKKPFQVGYFYQYSIHKKIKTFLNKTQPDHIYCQLIRSSEYVKNYHNCPKTIDYMDALSKGMERRAKSSSFIKRYIFNSEYKRLLNYENSIYEYFENHTIISQQDQEYIFHKNKKLIHVVPNGIDESFLEVNHSQSKDVDIVFIGNMSYPPNITAAQFITHDILPLLSKDTKIKIAGSSPSKEVLKLASEQVEVTGYVEDIKSAYWSAELFVAPMFLGTGLQNKLLEAMALGIPCITTTLANNALGAEPEKDILIADNAEEFAQQIMRLQADSELKKQIITNSRSFILDNYKWDAVIKDLIQLILK